MRLITATAINKRSVTVLAIVILLFGGVFAYRSLPVELFPEIDFPLVTVVTAYPSAHPEAVVRDVTAPVERAVSGTQGLESVQSTTFEGNSIVLATFEFGTDMAEAESDIAAAVNGIPFVEGVTEPTVGRFNPDQIPVIQLGVVSDRGVGEVGDVVRSRILPVLSDVDGVMQVQVAGEVERRVQIAVDPDLLLDNRLSLFQVSSTLRENNLTLPAGLVFDSGQAVLVKTTHTLDSVEDIENLVVAVSDSGPVRLRDVSEVSLGDAVPTSISRTNGKPSISVSIVKEPEANTIDVTTAVRDALDGLSDLPSGMEIVVVSDQGPDIQKQIDNLLSEAFFGFLFAVSVVFAFMLTIRPTVVRGLFTTLRPTVVIALSIPLSVFTGVLLMAWQDMSLNFMTLGGLAISVGRVVDDSIVVLENVYRHIQGGRERWRAALDATTEVGPAIFASTMTTIVVFVPLGFIQGLVGAFFLPFALTVTFALVASLFVALTAVPVLGAYLLRPGDLPEGAGEDDELYMQETWLQRVYTPILRWTLGHKLVTLTGALVLVGGSLGLLGLIPVTFFPSGGDRYLQIEMTLPPGTPPDRTLTEVIGIEDRISDVAEIYTATIGATELGFGGEPGGLNQASFLAYLPEDAPDDIASVLRRELDKPGRRLSINELSSGPPTTGIEISVTGPNYDDIASVSGKLVQSPRRHRRGRERRERRGAGQGRGLYRGGPGKGREDRPEHAPGRLAAQPVPDRSDGDQHHHRRRGHRRRSDRRPPGRKRDRQGQEPDDRRTRWSGTPWRAGRGGHTRGPGNHQPDGRGPLRQHYRRHHEGGHPGRRRRGGREDRAAPPSARRARRERRGLRRHRGGLPGHLRIYGGGYRSGVPGYGREPWVAA